MSLTVNRVPCSRTEEVLNVHQCQLRLFTDVHSALLEDEDRVIFELACTSIPDGVPDHSWLMVRIKLDALHAMMRVTRPLSKSHAMHGKFAAAFRDAIFVFDKAKEEEYVRTLKDSGVDVERDRAKNFHK